MMNETLIDINYLVLICISIISPHSCIAMHQRSKVTCKMYVENYFCRVSSRRWSRGVHMDPYAIARQRAERFFSNTCQKMRGGKHVKVKKRQRRDILFLLLLLLFVLFCFVLFCFLFFVLFLFCFIFCFCFVLVWFLRWHAKTDFNVHRDPNWSVS